MMKLYQRCHHWTILQVVAIVVCYRGRVLSERAQGCVWSQLSLSCHEAKVIQIASVVLGDTYCTGSSCCITDSDCTYPANANHKAEVHSRCNNKQSCIVGVLREKIPCGVWGVWYNNDFERITYNCIDDPQWPTTINFPSPDSTQNSVRPEGKTPEKKITNADIPSSTVRQSNEVTYQDTSEFDKHDGRPTQKEGSENKVILPVVMATVCLLLLIAIVIVVVMMKRKRWPKVGDTVQMTDLNGSNRKEAIYANEDQTMSRNHDNDPPIYSNHKIKKSRNKGKKSSKNEEVPSNAVYSLVDKAGSRPTEDPNIYCNADSRVPVYQVPKPRSNVYSLARDVGEPECSGSAADPSIVDNNVYCEAKSREPNKATSSSEQNVYDDACNVHEREYEAVKSGKSIAPTQKNQKKMKKKKTENPAHKTASDSNTKVTKLSKNVATSEPSEKAASKDKVGVIDGYPNPIYEDMSPLAPESVYANAPVLSSNSSVTSRSIPTEGSVTENPYCEMK